ncbi:MAG: PHP domain-containing protein, partial [Planctomycetota bacterium]
MSTSMSTSRPTSMPTLLSLRSWGSLLRGLESITALIEMAAKQGWHCAAVAEYADLGTIVEAANTGARTGMKIIGAAEIDDGRGSSIVAIAGDKAGLEQLHQLVSLRRLSGTEESAGCRPDSRNDFDLIEALSSGYRSLWILVR